PSYLCASAGCHRALLSFPTRRSSDLRSVAVEFRPPRPDERGGVPRRAVLPPRNPAATRPPAHADTAAAGHRGAPTAGSEVRRTHAGARPQLRDDVHLHLLLLVRGTERAGRVTADVRHAVLGQRGGNGDRNPGEQPAHRPGEYGPTAHGRTR